MLHIPQQFGRIRISEPQPWPKSVSTFLTPCTLRDDVRWSHTPRPEKNQVRPLLSQYFVYCMATTVVAKQQETFVCELATSDIETYTN